MLTSLYGLFVSANPSTRKLMGWKRSEQDDKWAEKAVVSLVKKLRKKCGALEELERALRNPGQPSKCVTIPRSLDGRQQISHRKCQPHVVYCQLWRWPDLKSPHELRPLECCKHPFPTKDDEGCINPYHYRRVQKPQLPAIVVPDRCNDNPESPVGQQADFRVRQLTHDAASASLMPHNVSHELYSSSQPNFNGYSSQIDSLGNYSNWTAAAGQSAAYFPLSPAESWNGQQNCWYSAEPVPAAQTHMDVADGVHDTYNSEIACGYQPAKGNVKTIAYQEPEHWASIAYYELNSRVGEMFHCSQPVITVDGYTNPNDYDSERFCLGRLSNVNRNAASENTRRYIGNGVQLHYAGGEVYAECQSDYAIFVQSKNCNFQAGLHPSTVIKLQPGSTLKIFDSRLFADMLSRSVRTSFECAYELTKMCTIRLSFVKGWGVEYQRQDVTATPCWIEIHLNGPLKWLDDVLTGMAKPLSAISSVS